MRLVFLLSVSTYCLLVGRVQGNDQIDPFVEDFSSVGRKLLQGSCTDEAPTDSSAECQQYADLGLCGMLEDKYCQQSCGKCCTDVLYPNISSCETVVTLGLCKHVKIRGIYCNISCDNCNILPEYKALLAFREAISDPFLLGKLNGTDPCSGWSGITCVQGHVDSIEYFDMDAKTSIPPEFSELKQLRKLIFEDEGITGTLPPELSLLENLEQFELINHEVRGTLPVQYSTWSNIQVFDMQASSLGLLSGTLPPEFSTWTNLVRINLHKNAISGTLPHEYSTWSFNQNLDLIQNRITGSVPQEYSLWYRFSRLLLAPQNGGDFCIPSNLRGFLNDRVGTHDLYSLSRC